MINITFQSKTGDPLGEILKEVETDIKKVRDEVNALGGLTEQHMKEIIITSKVRPQADEPTDLENAINTEIFNNGWGVGDIEKIKAEAPGWAALNFGSSHMVGRHMIKGVFDPGEPAPLMSQFRSGRWKAGESYDKKQYRPIVKNPIIAINYIERTVAWFENKLNELFGV